MSQWSIPRAEGGRDRGRGSIPETSMFIDPEGRSLVLSTPHPSPPQCSFRLQGRDSGLTPANYSVVHYHVTVSSLSDIQCTCRDRPLIPSRFPIPTFWTMSHYGRYVHTSSLFQLALISFPRISPWISVAAVEFLGRSSPVPHLLFSLDFLNELISSSLN